jgi:hypothetical protein
MQERGTSNRYIGSVKRALVHVIRLTFSACCGRIKQRQTPLDSAAKTPRTPDLGNPTEALATGLELKLKDFVTEAVVDNAQSISIPSSLLYDEVVRAESDNVKVNERKGKMVQLKPGARKRRRQRTPPEELKSDDERRFLELEEKNAKRTTRRDEDYRAL